MPWTTEPLSPAERADFQRLFDSRLEKVRAKTADAFAFKPVSEPPYLVNSAFYHVFGLDLDTFPEDYFDDPAVMTSYQERTYYEQVKEIDDDFVPCLVPWFGCIVAASAFGSQIEFPYKQDPSYNPAYYPIQRPEDIKKLRVPDPEKDGLMPKVLRFLRHMKEHSFLPVGITDSQAPLTTANQLLGYDKLVYLMVDHPNVLHHLMDVIAETQIMWVKTQKEVIGEPLDQCFTDQQVYTGEHAGVWMSDDDAVLMSAPTYEKFVAPYNSKVLQAFGGGVIHFCGSAVRHADVFLNTKGLRALNVYNLYDVPAFAALQKQLAGRIVMFACDFTPVEYEQYFAELLSTVSYRGLVIDSQFSPTVGLLKGGKYDAVRRDRRSGRQQTYDYLRNYFKRK